MFHFENVLTENAPNYGNAVQFFAKNINQVTGVMYYIYNKYIYRVCAKAVIPFI